jgi:PAS domain S-box-containing protein
MPERALAASFVAAFPGVVVAVDEELRIEFVGGHALATAGYDVVGARGQRVGETLSPETAALLVPRYRAALRGQRQTFDLPTGERTYTVEIFPRRDADGQVTGAYALALDVTERRREARVVASQLELAFAQSPIGIALVGLDGGFLSVNPAYCRLVGYSEAELITMSFQEITHPDDVEPDSETHRRLVRDEIRQHTMEKRYVTKDGRTVSGHLTVGVVRDDDGRPLHLITQVEDVTEQKRVEEQLRETQRLESLGLLAGGIAHDFNNLLVGVLGNASLLLAELPADAPVRPRVESIQLAAERAAALTRQMLAYSGRGRFALEAIDLSRETDELRQLLAGALPRQVDVRLDLARGLPRLHGDASQIRQVVMNLITNAAEAIDGSGTVVVKTGIVRADRALLGQYRFADDLPAGPYLSLEVSDDGAGMSDATLARIFDPFFTTKFTGRGLGLAAVLGIVRGHGGALRVRSEPGGGTTFHVLFPALPVEPDAAAARAPGTVLVVDDEEVVREVASAILVQAGRSVLTAATGEEAVRIVGERGEEIGLLLLDLTMPGLTAEETIAQVRALLPEVAIVLTSGYTEIAIGDRLRAFGAVEFLQKPWSAGELGALVDRALSS